MPHGNYDPKILPRMCQSVFTDQGGFPYVTIIPDFVVCSFNILLNDRSELKKHYLNIFQQGKNRFLLTEIPKLLRRPEGEREAWGRLCILTDVKQKLSLLMSASK